MELKKRFKLILIFYFTAVVCFVISCGNAILNHDSKNGLTGIFFLIGLGSGLVAVIMLRKFRAEAERLRAEREAREAAAAMLQKVEAGGAESAGEETDSEVTDGEETVGSGEATDNEVETVENTDESLNDDASGAGDAGETDGED
ncbi:MAG: hypothetical protein K5767_04760 [Clostridia bacterium]|nr:hypothetical protein [Clostridia bacterium]